MRVLIPNLKKLIDEYFTRIYPKIWNEQFLEAAKQPGITESRVEELVKKAQKAIPRPATAEQIEELRAEAFQRIRQQRLGFTFTAEPISKR